MAAATHKFQAPKGMRDFYPADMAVRRYIEGVWREVSINHGFEEIEGPMFEHTALYTRKSGPGIVSELFQVFSGKDEAEIEQIRAGKDAPYALRPEFTPTLARMVAARAAQLPKPIKWFAIPAHFRAERPQRGRLREFVQWNVDFIDLDHPRADAEVITCAVSALQRFGLSSDDVSVRIGDREVVTSLLSSIGCADERHTEALILLDKRDKLPAKAFKNGCKSLGLDYPQFTRHVDAVQHTCNKYLGARVDPFPSTYFSETGEQVGLPMEWIDTLASELSSSDSSEWCKFDFSIARGLAYYTGTVFEIIAEGERAVAGGGRYDNLIKSFDGPSMPACGFGMGDVVLGLLLHEKGLLPEDVYMRDLRPHAFVIAAKDEVADELPKLVAELRRGPRGGYHVRHTYRSTRNVGKLLGEAGKCGARTAIILDDKLADGLVSIKDLASGEQRDDIKRDQIERALRDILAQQHDAHV